MVKDKQMVLPQILIQANLGDELMRFTIHAHIGRKVFPEAPERIPKVSFGEVWYIPLSIASDLGDQPSFTHLCPPNKRLKKVVQYAKTIPNRKTSWLSTNSNANIVTPRKNPDITSNTNWSPQVPKIHPTSSNQPILPRKVATLRCCSGSPPASRTTRHRPPRFGPQRAVASQLVRRPAQPCPPGEHDKTQSHIKAMIRPIETILNPMSSVT